MHHKKLSHYLLQGVNALFVVAVFLLVWRRNHFTGFVQETPTLKPSDIIALVLMTIALIGIALFKDWRKTIEANRHFDHWLGPILVIIIGLLFGEIWARYIANLPWSVSHLVDWARTATALSFLGLTIFFCLNNPKNFNRLAYAFFGAVLLIPFLFIPTGDILRGFFVVSPASYNLLGFHNSVISLGNYLLIPLSLSAALFFHEKKYWKKSLWFILVILFLSLTLWPGSKGVWASAFLSLSFVAIMGGGYTKTSLQTLKRVILIPILFITAFFILSPYAQHAVLAKISPTHDAQTGEVAARLNLEMAKPSSFPLVLPGRDFSLSLSLVGQPSLIARGAPLRLSDSLIGDRLSIWKNYFQILITHPAGASLHYGDIFSFQNSYGQHLDTHSTWLQIAVSGGVIALLAFITFIMKIFKGLYQKRQEFSTNPLFLGLAASFIGMLVSASFINAFEYRWWWVVVGLLIFYVTKEQAREAA